ncbi:MAG: hypothetical protein ACYCWB_07815 [Thiobacillus sp.]
MPSLICNFIHTAFWHPDVVALIFTPMKISSFHRPSEATSWLPRLLATASSCVLLGAVSCSSPPAALQTPFRILIEFKKPVDGAANDLISRLETISGVSVRYVAPVSPKLHTYVLACPAGAPPCDAAIRALREDPAVLDISPDPLRKPLQTQP